MDKKIKILIVDDSALVRTVLSDMVSSSPDMEVMAVAQDPFVAAEKLRGQIPDVISLDIEMPRMDGITFLRKIMRQHPIPTVVCSTLAQAGSPTTMAALEAGAVDIIEKPTVGTRDFFEESAQRICDVYRAAAQARLTKKTRVAPSKVPPKLSADAIIKKPQSKAMILTTDKVIAVGASTGGTEALREFLTHIPIECPGIVIVQHMPENFTRSFAQRLDQLCEIEVKEAEHGDSVLPGHALIAPGNRHMLLKRSGARYYVEIDQGPLVNRHRPSVDVLFRSTAEYAGKNAVGVIMTGMGDDGARGMKEMRDAGARTIAQDEETCVVYGMPAEAVKHGGAEQILPLQNIASAVMRLA